MLDINDVIWYCSEIRHHIEKKRHHPVNANLHPLLKYVRSSSLTPRPTQPATTTAASSFSLSNVVSTVQDLFLFSFFPFQHFYFVSGWCNVRQSNTSTTTGVQCTTTIRIGMYWNDRKVNESISIWFFVFNRFRCLAAKRFNEFLHKLSSRVFRMFTMNLLAKSAQHLRQTCSSERERNREFPFKIKKEFFQINNPCQSPSTFGKNCSNEQ